MTLLKKKSLEEKEMVDTRPQVKKAMADSWKRYLKGLRRKVERRRVEIENGLRNCDGMEKR